MELGQKGWMIVLPLYLQQTTQRGHTPGLPVTYENTQTQVTERQTEDTGIVDKWTTSTQTNLNKSHRQRFRHSYT